MNASAEKKQSSIWTVILAAGKFESDLASIFNCSSSAMLPYRGRPIIYWSIKHALEQGSKVTIVTHDEEISLSSFIEKTFSGNPAVSLMRIKYDPSSGPGNSLTVFCSRHRENLTSSSVLVINGDTYSPIDYQSLKNETRPLVFVGEGSEDNPKYTKIFFDHSGKISYATQKLGMNNPRLDHPDHIPQSSPCAEEIGAYFIPNPTEFERKQTVQKPLSTTNSLFQAYGENVFVRKFETWVDITNPSALFSAQNKMVDARSFNKTAVLENGTFLKSSKDTNKMGDEIVYYQNLPQEFQIYFPRLLGFDEKYESYSIEYYPYRTLSEYFVFLGLPSFVWMRVLEKIFKTISRFQEKKSTANSENIFDFYWNKTLTRIQTAKQNPLLKELFEKSEVILNGQRLKGFDHFVSFISDDLRRHCDGLSHLHFFHGDLCFSNILLDPPSEIIRFVDPRGSFTERGVFGDTYYDLAKISHSLNGKYDFIIHEMFFLKEISANEYHFQILSDDKANIVAKMFNDFLERHGYEVNAVRLLEALLFLSMIPLHSDNSKKQIAFFLIGVRILNELYA